MKQLFRHNPVICQSPFWCWYNGIRSTRVEVSFVYFLYKRDNNQHDLLVYFIIPGVLTQSLTPL